VASLFHASDVHSACISLFTMHAMCVTHLFLLDWRTVIIFYVFLLSFYVVSVGLKYSSEVPLLKLSESTFFPYVEVQDSHFVKEG
jgi:hypothetical protein